MVIWMLQRRFLIQLHQYIHLVPSVEGVVDSGADDAFAPGLSVDKSHLGSSVEESSVLRRTTSSSDIASGKANSQHQATTCTCICDHLTCTV